MSRRLARRNVLSLMVGSGVAFAAACGGGSNSGNSSSGSAQPGGGVSSGAQTSAGAQPSGKQELRVNLLGEPDTIDPSKASFAQEITVVTNLWRGLLGFDKDSNLVPHVATQTPSVSNGGISADGLKYTFKLAPGSMFSDGVPVTSKHFAYALRRAITPGQAGDYATFYTDIKGAEKANALKPGDPGLAAAVAAIGVATPDDTTLVVELERPNSVFLQFMALWPAFPLREDVISKHGDKWIEAGNLIGNGPFVLKEWQHKDRLVFTRNDKYGGKDKPLLETITLRIIEDRNQAYNAYLAGELDQVSVPSELTRVVQNDPNLKAQNLRIPSPATFALQMNNGRPPFDNKKLRQAFAMAFDRDALVNGVFQGVHKPAYAWLPPGMPGHDPELGKTFKFDAAKAKQALSEAGFPDGRGLPRIAFVYSNSGNNPPMAEFLKEQFKRNLGVDIELEPVDSKTLQARFRAGDFNISFVGWAADYPDPENFLVPNFKTGAGNNKTGYSSRAFDDLLNRGQAETDAKKRLDLYKDAHRLLVDDMPVAFIYHREFNELRKPYVKGLFETGTDHRIPGDQSWTAAFVQK